MQAKFENVKGYATYANAQKKGAEVEAKILAATSIQFRWVVICLPTGRFAPCAIAGNTGLPFGAMAHAGMCVVN